MRTLQDFGFFQQVLYVPSNTCYRSLSLSLSLSLSPSLSLSLALYLSLSLFLYLSFSISLSLSHYISSLPDFPVFCLARPVEEEYLKQTHVQRQEAAQARRDEKKRQEKEKIQDLDPDAQRRYEEKEYKKNMRRSGPKVKQLKVKTG
eukprot:sb/3473772/